MDYIDPNGKRVRKSFKKKRFKKSEVEAELGKRVSLIEEGLYLNYKKDTTVTFEELVDDYTKHWGHQKSFDISKTFFIAPLRKRFQGRLISSITYADCRGYMNERRNTLTRHGKLRSASTLNKEVSALRHMLTHAVENEMLERNPFDMGKSLTLKENNKRYRYLSEEELTTLLMQSADYIKDIVEMAVLTGMRRGELLSLK